MSRPTHIAALDAALERSLKEVEVQNEAVAQFLDDYIHMLDAADEVFRRRANAHQSVRQCEQAIRTLGFVVVSPEGTVPKAESGLTGEYSAQIDREAARERRAARQAELQKKRQSHGEVDA